MFYDTPLSITAFSTELGTFPTCAVVLPHQTHSATVAIVERDDMTEAELEGVDALITQQRGICIGVRTADCVPILLYDPVQQAIAAIHSGWKGTVQRIATHTIEQMTRTFGTQPHHLHAIIGPSISAEAFQVGEELVEAFSQARFPMEQIHTYRGERQVGDYTTGHHLDLWRANSWLLEQAGIPTEQITLTGICTYADSRYPSYRRDATQARMITAIRQD